MSALQTELNGLLNSVIDAFLTERPATLETVLFALEDAKSDAPDVYQNAAKVESAK